MPTSPTLGSLTASVSAMLTRSVRMVLVLLLLAGGAAAVAAAGPGPAVARTKHVAHCRGLQHDDVRGTEPTYTRKHLAVFPNHKRVCHAIWLPNPRRYFVPQGLAIYRNSAWISGFRYTKGYGSRPCQLMRVNLITGRRLQFHQAVYGRVGHRPRTYCRHGGGILQRGPWLWIVEKNKLWLVDPAQRRNVINARRVWRIKAPVRGSTIVATPHRIGLVPFQTRGRAYIHWFSIKRLIKPGVLDLAVHGKGRKQLGAVTRTRIPRLVQGATLDAHGRLYLSRSNLACGELVNPYGRRVAFMPGAEGIAFAARGRRLWTVSESGAWPYAHSRKPLTPAVSSYEWPRLVRSKLATCGFPGY